MEHVPDPLSTLGALVEPLRRLVYEHVALTGGEVSRDGVASALGVARSVAAFHLDKLARAGLLDVEYRRPPERRGPGAGRPAKWYRRAPGEVSVSLPERRYALAAELLARAVERVVTGGSAAESVLTDVARAHGRSVAQELCPGTSGAVEGAAEGAAEGTADGAGVTSVERVVDFLARQGYEPRVSGGAVVMANGPFHALVEEHRDLVCRMNHAWLSGVTEEAGLPPGSARLDPAPGRCCVTIAT